MKILFIAPFPPPITGHALVSKALYDHLACDHQVEIIDLSKDSFIEGVNSFKRIIDVLKILKSVMFKKKNKDAIYLTISESMAGNIKDVCIYLICFRSLYRMYIHLHGGSIKRTLWNRHRILRKINRMFIKKLAGVIISGRTHMEIFDRMIDRKRIYVVPNFAPDNIFLTEKEILGKFGSHRPLVILYVSNFIPQKGYNELLGAFMGLNANLKKAFKLEFAGSFESKAQENDFLRKIAGSQQIQYHGVIDDNEKKRLFSQAHVFCLPTCFFEGQPISILEAYASGCVVLTTGLGGIRDIFAPGVNGFEIQPGSADSIRAVLEDIVNKPEDLLQIALSNRECAGAKYRASTFNSSMKRIMESSLSSQMER